MSEKESSVDMIVPETLEELADVLAEKKKAGELNGENAKKSMAAVEWELIRTAHTAYVLQNVGLVAKDDPVMRATQALLADIQEAMLRPLGIDVSKLLPPEKYEMPEDWEPKRPEGYDPARHDELAFLAEIQLMFPPPGALNILVDGDPNGDVQGEDQGEDDSRG